MLEITEAIGIADEELRWSYARSGGPGGQNVNKVASKAELRWDLVSNSSVPPDVKARLRTQQGRRVTAEGELLITSQRYRDQERNRQDCLDKLRAMLVAALAPPKPRRPTKPTRGSREARLRDKRARSARKTGRRSQGDE